MDPEYLEWARTHTAWGNGQEVLVNPPAFAKPGMHRLFMEYLSAGASIGACCNAIGVSKYMYAVWEKKADQGEPMYQHFIERARAQAAEVEMTLTRTWLTVNDIAAGTGDHRPIKDFLERWNPADWAPTQRIKSEVSFVDKSDEEELLRRLLPELATGGEDAPPEGPTAGGDGSPIPQLDVLGEAEPAPPTGDVGHLANPKWPWLREDPERGGMGPEQGRLPTV